MDPYSFVADLCTNRRHLRWICPLLLLAESALCALVIWRIPYTEIDWSTYMQQVSIFLSGERDYALIKGSTGPLVYPAAHVYVYSALYHSTDEGRDIASGQIIFAGLYLVTLTLVMACYRSARVPPYIFGLLVLSKRLHSVFLLRLFNDGVATLFLWAAIYMFQKRQWLMGVTLWSVGVGVKMTLLVIAPSIGVILVLAVGLPRAVSLGVTAVLIQILLAVPFVQENPMGYVSKAFEFTRQFLFKWTVNWRFIGEDIFLSKSFSVALLVSHFAVLTAFITLRWIRVSGESPNQIMRRIFQGQQIHQQITGSFVTSTTLESLVIGLLYARTLHYQFFAYLAWATPFLMWKSKFHPIVIFLVWMAQEWAWNVFPSTNLSSALVVTCLVIQVLGSFWRDERELDKKEHVQ